ncbi:MAG: hydrogenase iron-sulfur subunit [Desulfobulbaceae bacterium]|nr:hydrogenase iron-sulfur subunit [Desulfobulbaceae bacterium]
MDFTPDIRAFCCHYTSQQSCAEGQAGLVSEGFPKNVTITRLVCTGKLLMNELLKAFEEGADGIYVVGCPADECHNLLGSQRAAKKVMAVKKALAELDVETDRIEMFHLARGLHPEFIEVAQKMNKQIKALGPSPMKGETK